MKNFNRQRFRLLSRSFRQRFRLLSRSFVLITCVILVTILGGHTHAATSSNVEMSNPIESLKSSDATLRQQAVLELMQNKSSAEAGALEVLQVLKDSDQGVRVNAALALGRIGIASPEVIAALTQVLLKDSYPGVRLNAMSSLSLLQHATPDTVSALVQLLADPNERVRHAAAITLGHLGVAAQPAIPALIRETRTGDSMMRELSLHALSLSSGNAQEHPEILNCILQSLKDRNPRIHLSAIRALGHLYPAEPVAIHTLVQALEEQDISTRKVAMLALAKLGSDAQPATQALNQALKDTNPEIRATAAHALKQIHRTSK